MADLITVGSKIRGWGGDTMLVFDQDTGQHYVVATVQPPWRTQPETLVYPTDERGSQESIPGWGTERLGFVAGGLMSQLEGLADLSCRLDDNVLLTPEQAMKVEDRMFETDFAEFTAYIGAAPTTTGGDGV